MRRAEQVHAQLIAAGLAPYLVGDPVLTDFAVRGHIRLTALNRLRRDTRFQEGIWHFLHADVGKPRTEFRSHRGELGPQSSLQLVVNLRTGDFYADLDKYSPYTDLVSIVGHLFGEVIGPKVARLFTRKPKEQRTGDEAV